ncbi:MAG: Xaa-Pro aminopeptidase [Methylotenera sp. 24-45-7]|jgi:Xaa-Pro aminopeptidase|nr:MAG: Xaa-Pro aminopeptidase [Mehylophilales bacterium 35-46-6]OYZ41284.1 MAG: Xaa-Pro aminopeptidase [Methylotenera sp. 24-45-7]OZA09909.1 MAG: Xaa-Pro aminopeptidase [Methylotenera sp. 17-45-7]OZA52238.1 MAG: Xaa-Pro aminopeptidase [Methylophilales bacterium 39-45-7]HQS37010.1 aminopeptidase P N-terminal domain-containing protein [Methylotenera sp.]
MMNISIPEFKNRRLALMQHMGTGIAIIPTAAEAIRNRDSHYPYRFDSYFYYLSGFKEPESVLVLIAGDAGKGLAPKSILFCRDKDMEREIWDGFRYGPAAAVAEFGFDEAYSITELDELVPKLLANQSKLFFSLGADAAWDVKLTQWLNQVKAQARTGVSAPDDIADVRKLLDEMRLFKSPAEKALMRRSANIAASAHQRAMQKARAGKMEYEIEAEFLHEFYRFGAQAPAYTSIVAGGANACTLHYNANNAQLNDGDLLLIDAGCELDGYASDITRTFPVNGKFSAAQKDVYELVLASQAAAIANVKPGNHWNAPHEAALDVLVQGFIDFGWCKGTKQAVLETGAYRQFYMHRTGHWLGLDVHDAGEYKDKAGNWRNLEAGMVLTVEPGCYIRPADNVPEHFWNIGIRIEDDALVTADGCEILTIAAPKTVTDIETVMAQ